MTRSLLLLLEALTCHAIDYDYDERSTFKQQMREIAERLESAQDGPAALALATEAIHLVKSQAQEVESFVLSLAQEKQTAIHLMTESLLKVCTQSEQSAQNLSTLENELAKTSRLGEICALKVKLGEALDSICLKIQVQEERSRELGPVFTALKQGTVPVDAVTGLAGMDAAQAAFQAVASAGTTAYVVALTVRNLDVVNRRAGFAAGNNLLLHFSQEVTQRLSGKDRLFRWRGPCFVALIQRRNSIALVRQEAARFGSISQERTIEDKNSSIFFKMSTGWRLFTVPQVSELSGLSNQIDAFLLAEPHSDTLG